MRILGIITARGGSKGVPRKNIRLLQGKPLIRYTIEAALATKGIFQRIIVSTDDMEIAEISKKAGAEVPFLRPAELALDETSSLDVVQHAIRFVEKQDGEPIDWAMILQPTSPLRTVKDIQKSVALAQSGNYDSVVSVRLANNNHPLKVKRIDDDGLLQCFLEGAVEPTRRQDLTPDVYQRNGAIYLSRRQVFMEENSIFGTRICPYIMDGQISVDIDSELDFRIAEALLTSKMQV
ncbi:MAG: hypothetical protein COB67_04180 [SAR324 cluster bacterium]|uniref:Acylneuraminate cytidylyltransferase family protein n=1 Tax=SAR324 cluster bacterium TaxID=2024889 RepID=A0A2A4T8M6_9DELT|nr:MAG: hypothetical protein COB67_04180 [SAR324 cluster bacterium]